MTPRRNIINDSSHRHFRSATEFRIIIVWLFPIINRIFEHHRIVASRSSDNFRNSPYDSFPVHRPNLPNHIIVVVPTITEPEPQHYCHQQQRLSQNLSSLLYIKRIPPDELLCRKYIFERLQCQKESLSCTKNLTRDSQRYPIYKDLSKISDINSLIFKFFHG